MECPNCKAEEFIVDYIDFGSGSGKGRITKKNEMES